MATILVAGNEVNFCATASCNVINEFRSHTKLHLLDVNYGKKLSYFARHVVHMIFCSARRQSA